MADFQLITDSDGSTRHFHEDSEYVVRDNGVLVITSEGVKRTYGPASWICIEEDYVAPARTAPRRLI